jgi:NADH-quinone oxidoreductase subunit L
MSILISIIVLAPLLTFLVLYFGSYVLPRKGDWLACLMMGVTFVCSLILVISYWNELPFRFSFSWFSFPSNGSIHDFTFSFLVNRPAALMLTLVSGISLLVHIYSLEYMFEKLHYSRYFPYLGLFTSSMQAIVISDNLLFTFLAWEMVGFASFLLIGFWFEKQASVKASRKALLLNKVGDIGFLSAILILFSLFGTLDLSKLTALTLTDTSGVWLTVAGFGLLLGCLGKSAQFPFQLWLPEAMEGPTPASALIHAATMVAAGVFLLCRVFPLLSPEVLDVIAYGGAITAFTGALPALVQNDIKKVLAYSTISQLGYMFLAVGTGSTTAALFHLFTHAFFKACLFLSAGAVIHEMHHLKRAMFIRGYFKNFDTLNMTLMGGLRKVMPFTFSAYLLATLALIGVPFFSGYLSKEFIMANAFDWAIQRQDGISMLVPALALVTAGLTAFYMTRQLWLVFGGSFRLKTLYPEIESSISHMHDPGLLMLVPMLALSVFSLFPFFSWNPVAISNSWLVLELGGSSDGHLWVALLVSLTSAAGIAFAMFIRNRLHTLIAPAFLLSNWHLDSIWRGVLFAPGRLTGKWMNFTDRKIIDGGIHALSIGTVIFAHITHYADRFLIDGILHGSINFLRWSGKRLRSFAQGQIQSYLTILLILLLIIWLIILGS